MSWSPCHGYFVVMTGSKESFLLTLHSVCVCSLIDRNWGQRSIWRCWATLRICSFPSQRSVRTGPSSPDTKTAPMSKLVMWSVLHSTFLTLTLPKKRCMSRVICSVNKHVTCMIYNAIIIILISFVALIALTWLHLNKYLNKSNFVTVTYK